METGQVVGGKYRLRKKIGEGGMGSVWSAVHETLDRTVAIKFLQPSGADTDTAAGRFVAEARSAARVKHRFVVDVFDFGITELGEYYMVLELLEGEELADSMMHGAAWEACDVVRFMADCLTGLEAVHQAGIIHRDLKPENIFVMRDSDGRFPKLVDFGISKSSDPARARSAQPAQSKGPRTRQLTIQGTTVGTPWYMSPEQLRGRRDLDARADLYSIGVILYEWLTGEVPYAEDNLAELALKIAAGSALPLVSIRPELGHELSGVLARAMAPEPEGRFGSAAEMRAALLAVVPKLPQAWSVVQKHAKTAQPAGHKPMARGARTEALLEAAARSFGEATDERRPAAGRLRYSLLGLGALVVTALIVAPWFRSARPERASAHAGAEAAPERAAAIPPPAPAIEPYRTPPEAAPAPEPAAEASAPNEPTREAASNIQPARDAHEAHDQTALRSRTSKRTASRGAAKSASHDKALIHHLDF